MKYFLIAYLVTAAFCVAAAADEVNLTNGRTLVGIARNEEPNRVVVETRYGDLRFPRTEVQSIKTGRSDLHEYKERLDAIGACPSAAQLFELAEWAQDRGLIRYVNGLLTQAIALDPDHAEARSLLGYVKYEGNWMFASERDAILKSREAEHRTVAAKTVPVRRTRQQPEETPYSLGLPLQPNRNNMDVYPPRSPYNTGGYSSGGYDSGYVMSIGGVTPGGDVVINYPLRGGRIGVSRSGSGGGYRVR
jgi:hypothetical protein